MSTSKQKRRRRRQMRALQLLLHTKRLEERGERNLEEAWAIYCKNKKVTN